MPRTSALSPTMVLNNTPSAKSALLLGSTLQHSGPLHDTATSASARVGLTPTMAAAVVKLIGPDMPTSGLHVSLETV